MFPEYSGTFIFPQEGVFPRLTLGQDILCCGSRPVWHFPGLCPQWQEQPPHLGLTTLRITHSFHTALPGDAVSDRDTQCWHGMPSQTGTQTGRARPARSGRGQEPHTCSGPCWEAPGCFLGCPVLIVH